MFYDHVKIIDSGERFAFPVFKNPSLADISEIKKDVQKKKKLFHGIRFGVLNNGTIFAWSDYALHFEVEPQLRFSFTLALQYVEHESMIYVDDERGGKAGLKNPKLFDEIKNKILKLLPIGTVFHIEQIEKIKKEKVMQIIDKILKEARVRF
jgi:hypothetical protein